MRASRLSLFAGACVLSAASVAMADTYYFGAITSNNTTSAAAGEAQLRMEVTNPGGGNVQFHFHWVGSIPMSITDIYFDDEGTGAGVLDAFVSITGSAGVAYSAGASPSNLPGGSNFLTSSGLSADSDAPPPANGINTNTEFLDIVVDLLGTHTFADVIAALNQGFVDTTNRGLRVGLHVQAIGAGYPGAGGSEAFINLVPLPPAAWAAMSCLFGAMGIAAIRRHGINRA